MHANAPDLTPSVGIVKETLAIAKIIQRHNLTPKSFFQTFLGSGDMEIAYRRRYWATQTGWPSTLQILTAIRDQALDTPGGGDRWRDFILAEVMSFAVIHTPFSYYYTSCSTPCFRRVL